MITVEVTRAADLAVGVRGFTFVAVDGASLPDFSAGAHIDVEIRPGLIRQYSLCGPLDAPHYEIAVLREPASRGGSLTMAQDIRAGDRLRIGAPRNLFPLRPGSGPVRLLAGGIGITPILAMARALAREQRGFQLWYAGRSRASMAFAEDIATAFMGQAQLHADDDAGAPLNLAQVLAGPAADEHLYVCGPPGLITAALAAASAAGWPETAVYRESFVAEAPGENAAAFTVRLARTGRSFEIPQDRTVLDVLLESGLALDYSCEQGVCGSCVLPVLEGLPDHRDLFLTDAERAANDRFTPCCSRALTRELVLDL